MKLIVILFCFMFINVLYGQLECKRDSIDLSSKVSCVIKYNYISESFIYKRIGRVYSNHGRIIKRYKMFVRILLYYVPQVFVDIDPMYKDETRELSEHLKRARSADHDSIIYEYLKKELEPNHFASGYCLKYKISALKKWQGEYPYVDTEELYINRKDGKTYYELEQYRLMWVDSCQYKFSVYAYADKKRKIPKKRRCIRRNFNRLVETIYVRREDELVDLKPTTK